MSSLLERLEQREAAARGRVEELRAELDGLAERLAAEEERLSRLEITRQTVLELLAGDDLGEEAAAGMVAASGLGSRTGIRIRRLAWLVRVDGR